MAKKPKKAAESEEGAAEEAPKGGSKKKLILFGGIGVLALAGAGGGWFVFGPKGEHATPQKTAKPVAFVDMRDMVVNLASEPNQERPRVLKFHVALEVRDPKLVNEIQPLLPRVEDSLQVFVRELRASDLEGSGGVYRLREELLRRINLAVYPAKVDAVLFKDFIVQ